jgi:hypothetical protein
MDKCTWIGEGEGCAEAAVPGRSYCEQHLWRVYQQGTATRRRRERARADLTRELIGLIDEAVSELEAEGYSV